MPDVGSSPLARGLQLARGLAGTGLRIIPARAGFTGGGPAGPARWPDHPRSRGVYNGEPARTTWAGGSSPLARGLQAEFGAPGDVIRIIPARAGFTWPPDNPRAA